MVAALRAVVVHDRRVDIGHVRARGKEYAPHLAAYIFAGSLLGVRRLVPLHRRVKPGSGRFQLVDKPVLPLDGRILLGHLLGAGDEDRRLRFLTLRCQVPLHTEDEHRGRTDGDDASGYGLLDPGRRALLPGRRRHLDRLAQPVDARRRLPAPRILRPALGMHGPDSAHPRPDHIIILRVHRPRTECAPRHLPPLLFAVRAMADDADDPGGRGRRLGPIPRSRHVAHLLFGSRRLCPPIPLRYMDSHFWRGHHSFGLKSLFKNLTRNSVR